MTEQRNRDILTHLFETAVAAVSATKTLPQHLPPAPKGRTVMIAVGKAAAAMAHVALAHRPDIVRGLVIMPYGHGGKDCAFSEGIEVMEARHPVPDEEGMKAAQLALSMVEGLGVDDQLLALISGGGSALLVLPAQGISLAQKQDITRKLLKSGATITEINNVRSSLSRIKGGRLARAALPAEVISLVISDVPGDDAAYVASGPTVIGGISVEDGLKVLTKYNISAVLSRGQNTGVDSSRCQTTVIATADQALKAAVMLGKAHGYQVTSLGGAVEGEAVDVARDQAKMALRMAETGQPSLLLSGGETTVTLAGGVAGRGGRNCQYLLALALALDGAADIYAIACDTDGIDGTEDNAGAVITPTTLDRARALGLEAEACLEGHDSYGFFERLGDLILTGPTLTNVNDFRAILIHPMK